MTLKNIHRFLTIAIAMVWLINGMLCKVLNFVPRHREIVAHILGEQYASLFTILIGLSEIIMAIWTLSNYQPRFNALTQMFIVATMNILEFILVPDLLLWGRLNSVFALLFIGIVFFNEFILHPKALLKKEKE